MTHSIASTPSHQSVSAYDDAARVAEYDAEMEIMHPNRAKMADIVCAMLPFPRDAEITVLDLGTGTGFLAARLLQVFPHAQVIAVELVELEKKDGDQPLPLDTDLRLLKEAGFRGVDCFWKETREAVWGGIK